MRIRVISCSAPFPIWQRFSPEPSGGVDKDLVEEYTFCDPLTEEFLAAAWHNFDAEMDW